MFQPMPGNLQYNMLIADIEQGRIKIPQFQRDFVWSVEDSAKLLDSILKGFPIGTFILWESRDTLRSVRNVGNIQLPATPAGDTAKYVLDGQQRITSLYAAVRGVQLVGSDGKTVDYSEIYVDFEAPNDEQIVVTDVKGRDPKKVIRFTDLLTGGFGLARQYPDYLDKLENYSNAFKTYLFSIITVSGAPIDVATEIFTRINVGGKSLSVFEIMVAKTYDDTRNFDLSEKYDELIARLQGVDYETISSSTVLQAVSVCLVKECSKKHILRLSKNDFINAWDDVITALESAVAYFQNFFRIPVSHLLPYDGLLVPFTYYFYHHRNKPISGQQKLLQDYFWRVALTSRFSNALEVKIGQDIRRIDDILQDRQPEYEEAVDISLASLEDGGWFSPGKAYIKGFLCLLAYQNPESFADNALVKISNNYLKRADSKNYHHFFPKAYMAKKHPDDWRANHIANITIVDGFLNKNSIRDRAPSKYIKQYQKVNPDLNAALQTHLIGDPQAWGILNDDFDLFFHQRLKAYQKELKKRLILTKKDRS